MADMKSDGVVALLQLEGVFIAVGITTPYQLLVVVIQHPQLGLKGGLVQHITQHGALGGHLCMAMSAVTMQSNTCLFITLAS